MKYIIGIDIGGTKCAVTLGENNGDMPKVLQKVSFSTSEAKTKEQFLEMLFNKIDGISSSYQVSSIGISCGGPLDENKGVIISPPHLPLLHNTDLVGLIEARYNTPTYLRNDANACALAEWLFGAGKGCKNMVFFTFGTGLGAGLILDGKLYSGTNGNAGEAGHIRLCDNGPSGYGKSGSFEGFCSGKGIAQLGYTFGLEAVQNGKTPLYFKDGVTADITAKDIAIAAQNGDETAIKVYETSGKYLGRGLAIIVDILNPEKIVIGSIFARSQNLLLPKCTEELKKEALSVSLGSCEIVPANLGESVGDLAALAVAAYKNG